MSEPRKPTCVDDLEVPFERIGDAGWADAVRRLLLSYGAPVPVPTTAEAIARREAELGLALPPALRALHVELGPLDLDEARFLPVNEVGPLDGTWFAKRPPAPLQRVLPALLSVAATGSDDFLAMSLLDGPCCLASHDPPGLFKPLRDLDTLVKVLLLRLPCSRHGWPDSEVEALVDAAVEQLIGFRW